jgi:hypothetical protein
MKLEIQVFKFMRCMYESWNEAGVQINIISSWNQLEVIRTFRTLLLHPKLGSVWTRQRD